MQLSPTHMYKGWECYYDPPPIPVRINDWQGVPPDYDGPEDRRPILTAETFSDLKREIDDYLGEQ